MDNFSDNVLKNLPENIRKNGVIGALSKVLGADKLLEKIKDVFEDEKRQYNNQNFEVINTNVLD